MTPASTPRHRCRPGYARLLAAARARRHRVSLLGASRAWWQHTRAARRRRVAAVLAVSLSALSVKLTRRVGPDPGPTVLHCMLCGTPINPFRRLIRICSKNVQIFTTNGANGANGANLQTIWANPVDFTFCARVPRFCVADPGGVA
jgi:hypothetical protein